MTTLPEQFSEARKLQLEAQFNFLQTYTSKAFESVEKIIALNFDASRASLDKSSALVRQLMSAKDPRDLFAFTKQTQFQFDSVLAYGNQLFGIVAAAAPAKAPAPPAPSVALEAQVASAGALAPEANVGAPAAPIAEPTPIAKAAGAPEVLPKPSAASFPVASPSQPIEVTQVKPVEAEPPPAPASGTPAIVAKQAAAKASRKK
jgi:phasin family protein